MHFKDVELDTEGADNDGQSRTSSFGQGGCNCCLLLSGTLTVEQIYQDRDKFATLVREVAAPDVGRMGIEILSFTIKVRAGSHFSSFCRFSTPASLRPIITRVLGVSLLAGCVRSSGVPEFSWQNPDGCSEEGRRHRRGRSRERRRHQGRRKSQPLLSH